MGIGEFKNQKIQQINIEREIWISGRIERDIMGI